MSFSVSLVWSGISGRSSTISNSALLATMLTQFFPLLLCGALLSGCGSALTATTSDVAGIAGAGAASAVTKSPTAAAGIGLGIAAGANAGLQYVERDVHEAEQDRIAAAGGG